MPSPRSDAPRPVPPVQIIARARTSDRMSGPFTGQPAAIRNGLPAGTWYRVPGLEFPGCGCIYRTSGQHLTACQDHQTPQVPYLGPKRRYARA